MRVPFFPPSVFRGRVGTGFGRELFNVTTIHRHSLTCPSDSGQTMLRSMEPERPKSSRDDAIAVLKRLRDSGHVAYFAGGCVRDVLLGAEPKDYDVATDASPQKVRQLFRN